jgi:hypothetical protein
MTGFPRVAGGGAEAEGSSDNLPKTLTFLRVADPFSALCVPHAFIPGGQACEPSRTPGPRGGEGASLLESRITFRWSIAGPSLRPDLPSGRAPGAAPARHAAAGGSGLRALRAARRVLRRARSRRLTDSIHRLPKSGLSGPSSRCGNSISMQPSSVRTLRRVRSQVRSSSDSIVHPVSVMCETIFLEMFGLEDFIRSP